jgi:signal transduction histidine kinase
VDVAPQTPRLHGDRGRLQEIFLNLINNAFAALEDGGRLDIRARPAEGGVICVTVADTGCGIPAADINRIFEPFFSTKTERGGTGLGLSITYGLVQGLGGRISVESEVGKGTTFSVFLPQQMKISREDPHENPASG